MRLKWQGCSTVVDLAKVAVWPRMLYSLLHPKMWFVVAYKSRYMEKGHCSGMLVGLILISEIVAAKHDGYGWCAGSAAHFSRYEHDGAGSVRVTLELSKHLLSDHCVPAKIRNTTHAATLKGLLAVTAAS